MRIKSPLTTDLLISSVLMLLSASLFSLIFITYLVADSRTPTDGLEWCNNIIMFFSSALFVFGSMVVVYMSHPVIYEKMHRDAMAVDVTTLSFWEKYFTGNLLLIVSWIFFIGTFILVGYPIYGLLDGSLEVAYGVMYMFAVLVLCVPLFFWIVAATPMNMRMNNGKGSTIFYDLCIKDSLLCCDVYCLQYFNNKDFVQNSFGTDFLIGSWAFFIFALGGLPFTLWLVFISPGSFVSYLWLMSASSFALGAYLYAVATVPENHNSSTFWDCVCPFLCCELCCDTGEDDELLENGGDYSYPFPITEYSEESRRLLSSTTNNNNTNNNTNRDDDNKGGIGGESGKTGSAAKSMFDFNSAKNM